jgi:hypothetical protein
MVPGPGSKKNMSKDHPSFFFLKDIPLFKRSELLGKNVI